jgi:phenylalanyl-tRNA synthetase alpha subunit
MGLFPRLNHIIEDLLGMVQEDSDGVPFPAKGINEEYDDCFEKIEKLKEKIKAELEKWKNKLNCDEIKFVNGKMRFEIQIPEKVFANKKIH